MYEMKEKKKFYINPKISIIVPVYNTERYIKEMLESVRLQTFTDYEVIIINDGSTDGSREIIESFCRRDCRFQLYHQENKGVAVARNAGLEHAVGKYVVFYDPDDIIPRKALEKLYLAMDTENADLSIGVMSKFYADGYERSSVYTKKLAKKERISPIDSDLLWSFSLANKMFLREIIEKYHLRFQNISHTEDGLFTFTYLQKCKKIVGCNSKVYKYRQRFFWEEASLTQEASVKLLHDFIFALDYIAELAKTNARSYLLQMEQEEKHPQELHQVKNQYKEYESNLYKRLISISLINDFYRKIWKTTNDEIVINIINQKIEEYKLYVSPQNWEQIVKAHGDLNVETKLIGKKELAQVPIVSFVITEMLSEESINWVLKGIYNQMLPAFEVLISSKFEPFIQDEIKKFPNLFFQEQISVSSFNNLRIRGKYVNLINEDLTPGSDMILRHCRFLLKDLKLDFVSCPVKVLRNNKLGAIDLYNKEHLETNLNSFQNIDWIWGNKLFSKEALQRLLNNKDLQQNNMVADLYGRLNFLYDDKAFVITKFDEQYILEGCIEKNTWGLDNRTDLKNAKKVPDKKSLRGKIRKKVIDEFNSRLKLQKKILLLSSKDSRLGENSKELRQMDGFKIVTITDGSSASMKERLKLMYHIMTSSLVCSEERIPYLSAYKQKKGQLRILIQNEMGLVQKCGMAVAPVENVKKVQAQYKDYNYIIISQEIQKEAYAHALGLAPEKLLVLHTPKYEKYANVKNVIKQRVSFLEKHPELESKQLLLFLPAFKETGGEARGRQKLQWSSFGEKLDENQVLLIRKTDLTGWDKKEQGKVFIIEDQITIDLLCAADILITDYSNYIFDFLLMQKPIIFICPDYSSYRQELFLDFAEMHLGPLISDGKELAEACAKTLETDYKRCRKEMCEEIFGQKSGQTPQLLTTWIRDFFNN